MADLDVAEYHEDRTGLWTRGLLIRCNIADGDLAFFSTWCRAGTNIATLDKIEGHRWAIEDSFETAKNELGLYHNETPPRSKNYLHQSGRERVWLGSYDDHAAVLVIDRYRLDRVLKARGSGDRLGLPRICADCRGPRQMITSMGLKSGL